jgi:UDP-glucuronate 4-epimerase
MNVMITGGAGFVGSNLADFLLGKGDNIICYDNFDDYYNPQIKKRNISFQVNNPNYKCVVGDIRDFSHLVETLLNYKIDLIIHLAAKAGVRPSILLPLLYYDINVNGTICILEAMKKCGIKKMIFASSSSVYANSNPPFKESLKIDEPISPYASSKKAAELICYTYSHLYAFDITCLRFFTVYGPRQRPDLAIHKFFKSIYENSQITFYGDGSSSRDYTYITDIIQGIYAAILNLKGYNIYNLGESKTIQLNDLLTLIESVTSHKAILDKLPVQPGDVNMTYADISKARVELGYNPLVDMKTGLSKFNEWYLSFNKK